MIYLKRKNMNLNSSLSSNKITEHNLAEFEIIAHENDNLILNTISIIDLIIILIGTAGNLTSFYLLTRKRLRPVSSMRYLAALTLVDTLCLYGWYLSSVYRQLNDQTHLKRLENISAFTCKFISYISFSSLQLSSFLLCMLTIDRLLIIKSSKWRSNCANPKFANRIILALIMFVLAFNLIIPIKLGNIGMVQYKVKNLNQESSTNSLNSIRIDNRLYSIVENNIKHNFTMWHCYDDNLILLKIWNKLHLCLYSLLPFPILSILNLIVIRMTRDAAKSATQFGNYFHKFKNGQQFVTRLLLFLTISFFVCTVPSTIVYAFWHHQILEIRYGRVILNLLNTLQFYRHSSNWIIYVYSSSFMREEFKKCISCADSEYELAQAALAERPSVAIEILRQIELENNKNPQTNAELEDNDLDLYYLYLYYEKQKLNQVSNVSNTSTSLKSKNHHNTYDDCSSSTEQNGINRMKITKKPSKHELILEEQQNYPQVKGH